jgi:hypothetical protein
VGISVTLDVADEDDVVAAVMAIFVRHSKCAVAPPPRADLASAITMRTLLCSSDTPIPAKCSMAVLG